MWVREAWERAVGDRPSQPNPEGAKSARSSYRLLSAVGQSLTYLSESTLNQGLNLPIK